DCSCAGCSWWSPPCRDRPSGGCQEEPICNPLKSSKRVKIQAELKVLVFQKPVLVAPPSSSPTSGSCTYNKSRLVTVKLPNCQCDCGVCVTSTTECITSTTTSLL
uniref:Uncharacterized protein n=1 Tax=Salarias fasciatus TaxID=181472 RepID=A0A672FTW9_SALFA